MILWKILKTSFFRLSFLQETVFLVEVSNKQQFMNFVLLFFRPNNLFKYWKTKHFHFWFSQMWFRDLKERYNFVFYGEGLLTTRWIASWIWEKLHQVFKIWKLTQTDLNIWPCIGKLFMSTTSRCYWTFSMETNFDLHIFTPCTYWILALKLWLRIAIRALGRYS